MTTTLWRASLRYALRHPWQLGLALVGIALGVAVVVSIDLCIDSARRAFVLSNQAILGASTHRLVGGPSGVDERVYARLRTEIDGLRAAPVVEGHGTDANGVTLRVLGVDPFAEAPFRPRLEYARYADTGVLRRLLTDSNAALASHATAARLGVQVGDAFDVVINGRTRRLVLAGLLESGDALGEASLADVLVTDIATAQELLASIGRLSRVDLIADAGQAVRIGERLPPGIRIERAGSGTEFAERMTGSFNLNLSMLGLLALLVGMFLVFNTMTFSVVQRRELIGSLRAVGVTRAQIFALILVEAALVALVAVAAGLALGVVLAAELIDLVSRTINDLYFRVSVRELALTPAVLAKSASMGIVAALAAAALPALEATRVPPRATLTRSLAEDRMRRRIPMAAFAGALLLAATLVLVWIPGDSVALGFVALFTLVGGCALLAPSATLALLGVLRPLAGRAGGWLARLAVRGVAANLSRTAIAIAALMVALSATVGVGVMVDSFRRSVAHWLDLTMRADMYVGLPGDPGQRSIAPAVRARIEALAGVEQLSAGRSVSVPAAIGDAADARWIDLDVVVLEMARKSYAGFKLLEGDAADAWPAFDDGGAVLVSESLARRARLEPMARLTLHTERGAHAFPVAAIYRDYGSEHGTVVMSRATFDRHWDDASVSTLGVYAAEGVEVGALARAVRAVVAAGDQQLEVRDTRSIKQASMEVFDRTFTITAVLRALATVIAFVGVLSALMALGLERAKEVAVLRAQGLTPAEVWQLIETQSGIMGVVAGVLALPLGLAMALLLILVVNLRSFGWSMDVHVDPLILVQAFVLALAAALVAGIYPSYRMARVSPAAALRED
ncbi:MAG: ABC transporter permease [Gammaproteobacteria bacterium]|nr:ABC transporter permease [Gammaproteobacteria bacterium]